MKAEKHLETADYLIFKKDCAKSHTATTVQTDWPPNSTFSRPQLMRMSIGISQVNCDQISNKDNR